MSKHEPNHEIDLLIDAHLDQAIDEASLQRLQQIILDNPEASARLIERSRLSFQMIQVLRNEQSRDVIDPIDFEALQSIEPEVVDLRRVEEKPKPAPQASPKAQVSASCDTRQGIGFGYTYLSIHVGRGTGSGLPLRRLLTYAAVLMLAVVVIWVLVNPPEQRPSQALVEPPGSVEYALPARVIGSVDPVWDGPSLSELDSAYGEQVFQLRSGFVEMAFSRGARVIFEGPCQFEVLSNNSVRVDYGRLVASVPAQAKLFTVKTPTASVIDFGTEFGVDVLADGDTEVAVFHGLVELHEQARDTAQAPHRLALSTGQAARVDSTAGLDTHVKTFRPESQGFYIREIEDARRPDVLYMRRMMALEPLAYWPMMDEQPLEIVALGTIGRDLIAVGEKEVRLEEGPAHFEGSRAIAIDAERSFYTAGPFDADLWQDQAYSLALWARINTRNPQNIISFVPSIQERGKHYSNQIRVEASGKLQHYTYCPPELNNELEEFTFVRTVSDKLVQTNEWIHLTATYGKGTSRLYVNGKMVAEETTQYTFETSYSTLLIGGATTIGRPDDLAGDFNGAICQLAIFNRVLTQQEAESLSSSPRPQLN